MIGSSRVHLPSFPSTSTPCQPAAKTKPKSKSNLNIKENYFEKQPGDDRKVNELRLGLRCVCFLFLHSSSFPPLSALLHRSKLLLRAPLLPCIFWYFTRPKQRTKRAPSPYNIYIKENRDSRVAAHPGRPRTDGMSATTHSCLPSRHLAAADKHLRRAPACGPTRRIIGQPVDKRAPWRREGATKAVPKATASKKEESEEIHPPFSPLSLSALRAVFAPLRLSGARISCLIPKLTIPLVPPPYSRTFVCTFTF
ncbi:hypothetical protein B0H17DRAFT_1205330 [Mycena rosella]|uniref:Uncharacterized protein n=1 Tax=Mycena rosella TaxID=1033263 RepID=A0AAD7D795_MYCRO|nr:hypothetical protein B0H17DRAFT_1205330 [Mycena rosella]